LWPWEFLLRGSLDASTANARRAVSNAIASGGPRRAESGRRAGAAGRCRRRGHSPLPGPRPRSRSVTTSGRSAPDRIPSRGAPSRVRPRSQDSASEGVGGNQWHAIALPVVEHTPSGEG
jgi:hypothetical protein